MKRLLLSVCFCYFISLTVHAQDLNETVNSTNCANWKKYTEYYDSYARMWIQSADMSLVCWSTGTGDNEFRKLLSPAVTFYRPYDFKAGHTYVIKFTVGNSNGTEEYPVRVTLQSANDRTLVHGSLKYVTLKNSDYSTHTIIYTPGIAVSRIQFRSSRDQGSSGKFMLTQVSIDEDPCTIEGLSISTNRQTECPSNPPTISASVTNGALYQWTPGTAGTGPSVTGRGGMTYSLKVLTTAGCVMQSSNTITIKHADLPQLSRTRLARTLKPCDSVEAILPEGRVMHQWRFKTTSYDFGTILPETSTTLWVDKPGLYSVSYVHEECGTVWSSDEITLPNPGVQPPTPTISPTTDPLVICTNSTSNFISANETGVASPAFWWLINKSTPPSYRTLPETGKDLVISQSGEYTVSAYSAANNCYSELAPVKSVKAITSQAKINGPTLVCNNSTITLTGNVNGNPGPAAQWLWSTGSTTNSTSVTKAGTYYLTVTDTYGCEAKSPGFTVNSGGSAYIYGEGTLCPGPVTLTANYGTNYKWNTGATTQSIKVSNEGTYSCTVTLISGCISTASYTVSGNSTLPEARIVTRGQGDVNGDDHIYTEIEPCGSTIISTYPNPAKEKLLISLGTGKNVVMPITIVDSYGKSVSYVKVEAGKTEISIDVQHLPEGVYVVKIGQGKTAKLTRIFIDR
jgi:hypothetical protein